MEKASVKESLHELIDKIDDTELLSLHLKLLQKEMDSIDFFSTNNERLMARAKESIASVEKGRTRPLKDFNEEVDQWKANQSIQ